MSSITDPPKGLVQNPHVMRMTAKMPISEYSKSNIDSDLNQQNCNQMIFNIAKLQTLSSSQEEIETIYSVHSQESENTLSNDLDILTTPPRGISSLFSKCSSSQSDSMICSQAQTNQRLTLSSSPGFPSNAFQKFSQETQFSPLVNDYQSSRQKSSASQKLNFDAWNQLDTSRERENNKSVKYQLPEATDRFIPSRRHSRLEIALTNVHEIAPNDSDQTGENHQNSISSYNNSINGSNNIPLIDDSENQLSIPQLYQSIVLGVQHQKRTKQNINVNCFQNNNVLQFYDTDKSQLNRESILLDINRDQQNDYYSQLLSIDPSAFVCSSYRKISKIPYKVLDAPALQDDFYLNLIDWSEQNILGVGLGCCVYLWSAINSKVTQLCDLSQNGDSVCSVAWSKDLPLIAIGSNYGEVILMDAVKLKQVKVLKGHKSRVGCLAWKSNYLATGSRDKSILIRDIRSNQNFASKLTGHHQEICGLKWSYDQVSLASGGNDNQLLVWNQTSTNPVLQLTNHVAAIKALAWSPHQHGLLVSGGGTADRSLRFWNTLTGSQIDMIDTGSQVCNLLFSKTHNEFVSTHGYSKNQIIVWKYPEIEKVSVLNGHNYRVLYLAISPDGQTIVTGAGDETIRFWHVFPEIQQQTNENSALSLQSYEIR